MKWVASERLCFASKQSPNFEDFNMVKRESRPQTNDYQQCRKRTAFGSESYSGKLMWGSRVRASQGSQNLKENLKMFGRKTEYEEDKRGIPDIWKLIILVVVVVTAYIGVNKFTDWVYEEDMKFQYQGEYYEEVV